MYVAVNNSLVFFAASMAQMNHVAFCFLLKEEQPTLATPTKHKAVYRRTSIFSIRKRKVDLYLVFAFVLNASTRKSDVLWL